MGVCVVESREAKGGGRSELVSFPSILLLLYISKVEAKAERLTVCESNSRTFIPETSVNILSRKKLIALEVSISSFPSLAGGRFWEAGRRLSFGRTEVRGAGSM